MLGLGISSTVDTGWAASTKENVLLSVFQSRISADGGSVEDVPCLSLDLDLLLSESSSFTTGLLEFYPGAAAAYSLRQLRRSVSPAIRVRRSGDSLEQDIGFNSNGELDTNALLAFANGGDAWVDTWYDQSSNGNDAVQDTTESQPQIVSSGSLVTENGKPALLFDGSNDYLETSPTISAANGFAAAFVSEMTATGVVQMGLFVRGANCAAGNLIYYNNSSNVTVASGRTSSSCGYVQVTAAGMNSLVVALWDWANDTLSGEFDGSPVTPITTVTETSTTIDLVRLGLDGALNYGNGKIQECIIWPSNSLTIADISDAINTHYSIY